jgi:predicted dehydrogenase
MSVRIGLVGLGFMGSTHARAYREIDGAELVAVCDTDPDRLKRDWQGPVGNLDVATPLDLGGVRTYRSLPGMLRGVDLDMVDLCVPTCDHPKLAIKALQAGKHLFCEKPLALKAAQAVKVVDAAREAGRHLMVGHVLRFWPEYVALKRMIDEGTWGKVRSAVFRRISGYPSWDKDGWLHDEKRGGSAALDLHIHDVDTIQWFFGPVAGVTSRGVAKDDGGFDHITTMYEVEGMEMVTAEAAFLTPTTPFEMSAEIEFERALAVFSTAHDPTLRIYPDTGEPIHPDVDALDGYTEELRYFVTCLDRGEAPSITPPASSAQAVAVVEAEKKSAAADGRAKKVKTLFES